MSTEILQLLPEGLAIALAALPDTHKERTIRYFGKLIKPIGKQSDSQKLLRELRDKRFRSVYEQRPLNNVETGIRTVEILVEDESSTANTDEIDNPNKHDVPEDEWISEFENQSRHKSSSAMRERFARLLAGEIKRPGTFSLRTIRLLGEIDEKIANIFKILCSACISFDNPLGSKFISLSLLPNLVDRNQSNADLGLNNFEKYGISDYMISRLVELGLLEQYVNFPNPSGTGMYVPQIDMSPCFLGENERFIPFLYSDKYYVLDWIDQEKQINWNFKLIGFRLSSVGMELMNIVDKEIVTLFHEDMLDFLKMHNLRLLEVKRTDNGGFEVYRWVKIGNIHDILNTNC